MVPIYEQIVDQIKALILEQVTLKENDISAIGAQSLSKDTENQCADGKKGVRLLWKQEGLAVTIHGKGTYRCGWQTAELDARRATQRKWKHDLETGHSERQTMRHAVMQEYRDTY